MKETEDMSTAIEPSVKVEARREPLPPREQLERIFAIDKLTALYGGKPASRTSHSTSTRTS
jgi:hypothetical protein